MADAGSSSPSPSSSDQNTSANLDRSALERILARAAELQSGQGESPEGFSEEQLLELGREVGLSPHHLRQALAEERTRSVLPEHERGIAARVIGPSRVQAARLISGRSTDVLATIDAWMQRQELLVVKRHHADRIVWEPRRDLLVGVKRLLRVGGRDYTLSQSFEVSATVVPVDDRQVHVGLDADFGGQRAKASVQAATTTVVGGLATASLFVLGFPVLIAAAPIVLAPVAGIGAARALQGRVVTRAQLALEQLLDRLERGDLLQRGAAQSLLGAIVAAATATPPRRY